MANSIELLHKAAELEDRLNELKHKEAAIKTFKAPKDTPAQLVAILEHQCLRRDICNLEQALAMTKLHYKLETGSY